MNALALGGKVVRAVPRPTVATVAGLSNSDYQAVTTRYMSKYLSKAATKRLPLNTKRAGKGYKKGKGSTKEGRLDSKANFIPDPTKKLELVVPDLEGFKLKPYIAMTVSKFPPETRRILGQIN